MRKPGEECSVVVRFGWFAGEFTPGKFWKARICVYNMTSILFSYIQPIGGKKRGERKHLRTRGEHRRVQICYITLPDSMTSGVLCLADASMKENLFVLLTSQIVRKKYRDGKMQPCNINVGRVILCRDSCICMLTLLSMQM